jgi:hypothetical protein
MMTTSLPKLLDNGEKNQARRNMRDGCECRWRGVLLSRDEASILYTRVVFPGSFYEAFLRVLVTAKLADFLAEFLAVTVHAE